VRHCLSEYPTCKRSVFSDNAPCFQFCGPFVLTMMCLFLLTNIVAETRVKFSFCCIKHHDMKTYGGLEVQLRAFLTSALGRREWSSSQPDCFTSGVRDPSTISTGGSVDPRVGRDSVEKRKKSRCYRSRKLNHGRPTHSLASKLTEPQNLIYLKYSAAKFFVQLSARRISWVTGRQPASEHVELKVKKPIAMHR
jgi:hypothetical protein